MYVQMAFLYKRPTPSFLADEFQQPMALTVIRFFCLVNFCEENVCVK